MTIIYSAGDKPIKLPKTMSYDSNEKKYYSASYRPKDWALNTEYKKGIDLIIPPTPNGLFYECTSGGISGATQPVFGTIEGKATVDGSVSWTARAYDLFLNTGDTITSSNWTGSNSEVIDNASIVNGRKTKFRLTGVPLGATSATIVNHITVSRANGDIEEFDRTIIIPIKAL